MSSSSFVLVLLTILCGIHVDSVRQTVIQWTQQLHTAKQYYIVWLFSLQYYTCAGYIDSFLKTFTQGANISCLFLRERC